MNKLSLLDKLKVLWEISKGSYMFIIVLVVLLIFGIIFFTTNKRNYKRNKLIYIIGLITATIVTVVGYHGSLSKLFDYMMNNLFIAVYFPNLAIYFAAIIVSNIILWSSIFNFKTTEVIKRLNIIIYIILNYIFALVLNVINTNKLDIFNQASIYNNEKARALIELSGVLFAIWMIFLIIYKIILIYVRKDYKPRVKKVLIKKVVKKFPENYQPKTAPTYVIRKENKKVDNSISEPIKTFVKNETKEIIEEFIEPVIVAPLEEKIIIKEEKKEITKDVEPKIIATSENITSQFEQMLTVDDYKLLLKMLQEQREKERIEKIKQDEQLKETNKYVELQTLYEGAR